MESLIKKRNAAYAKWAADKTPQNEAELKAASRVLVAAKKAANPEPSPIDAKAAILAQKRREYRNGEVPVFVLWHPTTESWGQGFLRLTDAIKASKLEHGPTEVRRRYSVASGDHCLELGLDVESYVDARIEFEAKHPNFNFFEEIGAGRFVR